MRSTIEMWLEVQRDANIDYPCVQPDMIEMFLLDASVSGIQALGGRWSVDFDTLEVTGSVQHEYLNLIGKIAAEIGYEFKGFMIPVTGPFTLAERMELAGTGRRLMQYPTLLAEFSRRLVKPIVRSYDRTFKGSIIRIDEPIAQAGMLTGSGTGRFGLNNEFVAEIWSDLLGEIQAPNISGIHVCGDAVSISSVLQDLPHLTILSHEFFTTDDPLGRNLMCYRKSALERNDKVVGFGCVNSKTTELEPLEEVERRMRRGIERFGRDSIHLNPACGFGGLSITGLDLQDLRGIVLQKLRVLDMARKMA